MEPKTKLIKSIKTEISMAKKFWKRNDFELRTELFSINWKSRKMNTKTIKNEIQTKKRDL